MDVELPDGRVITDVPEGTTRTELMRRVGMLDRQRRVDAQMEADRKLYDPTRGMSGTDKVLANIGAGMANLGQGVQQIAGNFGLGSGVSDEDVREKRQRDQHLADATTGGGALQIAGEIAPTLVIPAAAFARPMQLARVGPLTQLLAGGATAGATASALSPVTSDESRGANAAIGATLGVVVPGAGSAAGGAVRGARRMLTEGGAKSRAIDAIAEHLPDGGAEIAARMDAYRPLTLRGQPADLPVSAAQASGDARLAQLEAGSRSRPSTQPAWADFDAAQNSARYEAVQRMAPSDLRLQRLERTRELATRPGREAALSEAAQRGGFAEPVVQHAQGLLEGATGANPAVESLAKYVQRTLGTDAVGAVTPQRLYEVRKVLASKLNGPAAVGDELSAAAKGARREAQGLISAIDDAIDATSSGQWRPYLSEYAKRSAPVTSGRALQDIAGKISDKPMLGNTPHVTAAGYGQALRQFGQGKFGSKLDEIAGRDPDAFLQHLKEAEAASRSRKLSATMGGGSITNSDQLLAQFTGKVLDALPGIGGYATRLREFNRESVEREMARLLQSPTQLGAALRSLPPNRRQQMIDAAYRQGQMSAGAAAAEGVTP